MTINTMDDDSAVLSPRESLRRAKVDLYLERATEYHKMGRYALAQRTIETLFLLDPENPQGHQLQTVIRAELERLEHRSNGHDPVPGDNGVRRPRRSELVCVVDQDERLLLSLNQSLRREGFDTICAGSYDEALDLLQRFSPDIILSEVNFESGPRGFDLYLWVKTNRRLRDVSFLFLAMHLDREILIAGKRFGVDDFILKPVDDDVVIASVLNCIARKRSPTSA
jgi:PleD family two-component response regulator